MHRIALLKNHLAQERVAIEPIVNQSNYVYTVDETADKVLTKEQRDFYEENGYLVIRNLMTSEELKRWDDRFVDICRNPEKRPLGMQILRDISVVKKGGSKENHEKAIGKIQDWQEDPVLFEYCQHPNILKYMQCFCGYDVKTVHTMLISKQPNVGKTTRHPLHQDLMYFPFRPAERIACSWTSMVPVNRENGGLVVIPGTHKGELVQHTYPDWESEGGVNKAYYGIKNFPKDAKFIYLEMQPGDTVFFHPLLIHGSGTNKTDQYRRSISCHYASSKCQYVDPKGTHTEPLAKEIVDYASKLFGGTDMTYIDIWKFKSKLAAGKEYPDGL